MNMPPAGPPPKKGLSTLSIVLIIVGVVLVLGIGTCAAGAIWLGREAKEIQKNIADGGLVLVSPPEVVAQLAGDKKDYVGSWVSESGKSTLEIHADGNFALVEAEHGTNEKLSAPIAAFVGNDLEVKLGLTLKVTVQTPPHKANNRWEMTAKGITFHRSSS